MNFHPAINRFLDINNQKVWEGFYTSVANELAKSEIPLENVFFVNTPGFTAFLTEGGCVVQKPASDYVQIHTRKVIVEKDDFKKFKYYSNNVYSPDEKIVSKSCSVNSYRLNWNASLFGEDFDLMRAFKKYIESKSQFAIFLYIDSSFFSTIKETKIIRASILNVFEVEL